MNSDYDLVASAVQFYRANIHEQPGIDRVAAHLGLSASHFQRLFKRWAGVTPKRYLEFLTVERSKRALRDAESVLEASLSAGLSGPGRLHDHFVKIEAVSPGEYKHRGAGLTIEYGIGESLFGTVFYAQSARGLMALRFCENPEAAEIEAEKFMGVWDRAGFHRLPANQPSPLDKFIQFNEEKDEKIALLVKGTNFQISVWKALLQLPTGNIESYQAIAGKINKAQSVRAVANAIGANPIAFLIPCHRVLRSDGGLGGYRWGSKRKEIVLAWEQARVSQ